MAGYLGGAARQRAPDEPVVADAWSLQAASSWPPAMCPPIRTAEHKHFT